MFLEANVPLPLWLPPQVLRWMEEVTEKLGANPTKEQLTQYVQDTLAGGKVVPGYGHAVLRKTDPRYTCQVCVREMEGGDEGGGMRPCACVTAAHLSYVML